MLESVTYELQNNRVLEGFVGQWKPATVRVPTIAATNPRATGLVRSAFRALSRSCFQLFYDRASQLTCRRLPPPPFHLTLRKSDDGKYLWRIMFR